MEIEVVKPTLKVDLDVKLPELAPVEHNLGIIEDYALKLLDFYSKLVFTNDQYKEATDERTKVNKLKKVIEENRKEIVKEYKKPIDDFETTSKRIEKLLSNCVDTISQSIEKFDMEQAQLKNVKIIGVIEAIRQDYILNNKEFENQLKDFNIEYDKRWYNKTYKDKDIENDIDTQFNNLINDLYRYKSDAETVMNFFNTINVDNLLSKDIYIERFKFTRDVNAVINDIKTDYEAKKNSLQTQNTKEELIDPFAGLSINNKVETKPRKVIVEIQGLESQLDLIKMFAKQNNLEIGEIVYGE